MHGLHQGIGVRFACSSTASKLLRLCVLVIVDTLKWLLDAVFSWYYVSKKQSRYN